MSASNNTPPYARDNRRNKSRSDAGWETIDMGLRKSGETWRHAPNRIGRTPPRVCDTLLMASVGFAIRKESRWASLEDRSGTLLAVDGRNMRDESTDEGWERSELQSVLIDETCSRFEMAWQTCQQPRIEDFLSAESPDKSQAPQRSLLLHLVGIDLECRWKTADMPSPPAPLTLAGEGTTDASESSVPLPRRPRLADYVARYSLLGPVEQLPDDLIVNEYYARCRYGDRPTHAEYLDAFGSRHPELAKQLQAIDDGMAAAEHLPSDLVSDDGPPLGNAVQYFGEYVVLGKLGEGGMGVVLKAQHRRMKRFVAVKMIAKKELGSPEAVKRYFYVC